jgi:hypothetical protein
MASGALVSLIETVGGGGGLVTEFFTTSDDGATLSINKHYIVDVNGAGTNLHFHLPAVVAEAVIKVSWVNNATNGKNINFIADTGNPDKILFEETEHTDVTSAIPESWVEFHADVTNEYWTVDLPAQTIAGTLYGDLTVTGNLKLATTGGTASNLNYYEELTISSVQLKDASGTILDASGAEVDLIRIYLRRIGSLVICQIGRESTMDSFGTDSMPSTSIIQTDTGIIPARFLNSWAGSYSINVIIPATVSSNNTSISVGIYNTSGGNSGRIIFNTIPGTSAYQFGNQASVYIAGAVTLYWCI